MGGRGGWGGGGVPDASRQEAEANIPKLSLSAV